MEAATAAPAATKATGVGLAQSGLPQESFDGEPETSEPEPKEGGVEVKPASTDDDATGTFLVFEGPAHSGPWNKVGWITEQASAVAALRAFFDSDGSPAYDPTMMYVATSERGFRPRFVKPKSGLSISDAEPEDPDAT